MKLYCRNTENGLIPLYDSDQFEKSKLKLGDDYQIEIKKARNIHFHKKYFALIKCTFLNLPEHLDSMFHNPEILRKALQIEAGFFDIYYLLDGTIIKEAQSISFENMDETKFQEVYNKVLDVILQKILIGTTAQEINSEIYNFL